MLKNANINEMNKYTFPAGFIWGSSTSSHQVEGGNLNDWTEWEKLNAVRLAQEAPGKFAAKIPHWEQIKDMATNPGSYISGKAADHYARFREDIELMESLNIKAYRFSIEWSRIEPEPGKWNQEGVDHYREVIRTLREKNIEPFVTLWHRTNPLWIAQNGDWANKETVERFLNYVHKVVQEYGSEVKYWMTLNEPALCAGGGFVSGQYPPNIKNPIKGWQALNNFASAHNRAYTIIHNIRPDAVVGIPHAAIYVEPYKNKLVNHLIVSLVHYFGNWKFLDSIKDYVDFIGIQYYSRGLIDLRLGSNLLPKVEQIDVGRPKSDMGWEIYPEGIYNVIKKVHKRYHIPLYITENGIADANDTHRQTYIQEHLKYIHRAISDEFDVRGYFYWSLLDNLEWDKGFWPRFGLVEVDYKTQKRTVRPSARVLAEIIKNNRLELT